MSAHGSCELVTDEEKIFYFKPFSLARLAACQVARQVWYNNISHFNLENEDLNFYISHCNKYRGTGCKIDNIVSEWMKCLGVSESLNYRVGTYIYNYMNQTAKMIRYFNESLFSSCLETYSIRRSDQYLFVWSFDGNLDYKNTAINMLSRSELNNAQKFVIICHFCLEDEIETYSRPPMNIVVPATIDQDPALYYWICYLRGELYKIFENYTSRSPPPSALQINIRMATITASENCFAFEYFSNRVNDHNIQLVPETKSIVVLNHPNLQRFLSDMPGFQQNEWLFSVPEPFFMLYVMRLLSNSLAFGLWTRSKHLVSPRGFYIILHHFFFTLRFISHEKMMSLLVKIWDTASNDQINYVISKRAFIRKAALIRNNFASSAMELFYRWLSLESVTFRREIIESCAARFFLYIVPLRRMKDLWNLCLPSPTDLLDYKRFVLNSKEVLYHCRFLLAREKFHILKQKLEFYSPDVNFLCEYMKRILDLHKSAKAQFVGDFHKWSKLSIFLNDIFPNDSTPEEMKKQFILSYAADCQNDFPDTSDLSGKMQVAESMFQNEQLENIKRLLLNPFKKVFAEQEDNWWYFMENQFLDFVSWCWSQDENSFSELKNSISADTIFDKMFEFLEEDYILSGGFDRTYLSKFDYFSTWLFLDAKRAKEYKLDKMSAIDGLNIFKFVDDQKDELNFELLLKWFFDGDEAAIRKFKNKKHRSK